MTQSYETALLVSTGIVLTKPTARFEIAKWIRFAHIQTLQIPPARLKLVYSDNTLRAGLEVAEGRAFCHPARLRSRPARLKTVLSDSAMSSNEYSQRTCVKLRR